jgi:hypothetical protein
MILIVILSVLQCSALALPTDILAAPWNEAAKSQKVKHEVEKRGVGQGSRAKVKLRDGSEVKGYISKISDTSFEITDKAGNPVNIPYSDIAKVKNPGLSRTAKIAIVAGVGAAVVVIAYAAAVARLGNKL